MDDAPRALFISTRPVWPLTAGYALRTNALLGALDVVIEKCDVLLVAPGVEDRQLPPDLAERARLVVVRVPRRGIVRAGLTWLTSRRPRGWSRVDWAAARTAIADLVRQGGYQHVVASGIDAWETLGPVQRSHVVIDIDDLETSKIDHRMANAARTYVGWRGKVQRWVDRVERRRWAAIEAQVAHAAAAVVVCSARDVELVEAAKTFVIANPYPPSTITAEERGSGSDDGHTITFIGTLTTPPNQEACALLVNEIMPRVWATVPSARLRLVGTTPAGMAPPDDDRITVTGFVEDPNDELRRATLAVAPFLSGGGTRIKILEAFRAGVPVVATSVGIEGIDATDGVHAVVRDDPRAFADACVRLLGDRAFALRLAGAAAELVATRHSPKAISASLASALEATSCGR